MNQERVHPLVRERRMAVVPGVYDVLSAKIAEHVGFPAVVLTGYGVAASHLGEPDFDLLTQTEILDVARRVTAPAWARPRRVRTETLPDQTFAISPSNA